MKIQKAELAQKIAKLKGIVPKKPNMPVLQGILVKDGYLTASNIEMTVKTKLEGIEDECFIIPQKAFDCENVGIQLAGGRQPMIVEAEDSDFRALVLPVAIH